MRYETRPPEYVGVLPAPTRRSVNKINYALSDNQKMFSFTTTKENNFKKRYKVVQI
jgi:hypothetical protein